MARKPRLTVPRVNATVVLAGLVVTTIGTGATALTAEAFSQPHSHPVAAAKAMPASPTAATTAATRPAPLTTATDNVQAAPLPQVTAVPRPKHLVNGTLLVTGTHSLTAKQRKALGKLSGVVKTETVASGSASIDGHRAFVLGVDPATFRPWTPKLTAKSDPLWQSIARGELTADFDMGNQAKLPLGKTVPVTRTATATPLRIGAFASIGMSDVDAVVDQADSAKLGLVRHSGIVLSAPKADPLVLRKAALTIAGRHAHAQLLREVIITRDAGEYLTRQQISGFLHTAASRIGMPYVWGAEGPKAFDCSGLVQWSFARIGIRMPRVAAQQWFAGPHIAYKDARPGDLLFWHYDPTDPTDIDHVAIYAGNGMMIVAPHTGLNVQYVPVPTADMAGVVRVDPALAAQIA